MDKKTALQTSLVQQAFTSIANDGLDNISLRAIAEAAGCSTNGIFQYFGGKSALIEAAIVHGRQLDKAFHTDFFGHAHCFMGSHLLLSDVVVAYLGQRSRHPVGRFWSEILFNARGRHGAGRHLAAWHEMRVAFWGEYLAPLHGGADLAQVVTVYSAMEGVYGDSLGGHLEYQLLLNETVRALLAPSFDLSPVDVPDEVSQRLGQGSSRFAIADVPPRNELCEELLNNAAQHVLFDSISTLNQRKIAKDAGTSQSMISYHFGNLENFVNEAIWRAMLIRIPNEVNPAVSEGRKLESLATWAAFLADLICAGPGPGGAGNSGFYINIARITGQVSLLAAHRNQLLPVVDHLRNFEGSGSFRASQTIWPTSIRISRSVATAFGIWIKGRAILNMALGVSPAQSELALLTAGKVLFGVK